MLEQQIKIIKLKEKFDKETNLYKKAQIESKIKTLEKKMFWDSKKDGTYKKDGENK